MKHAMIREWKMYSQQGQDGVIDSIFSSIGAKNSPPVCIEFGFNALRLCGGSGANTAHLIQNKGWNGLLFDGGRENLEMNLRKEFMTSSNVCAVFHKYDVPHEPDYVSIDVDSCDLWIFKAMLKDYKPQVVSVECNPNIPLRYAITFPDDPNERWRGDRVYGASLKALKMVGDEFGYNLVHVVGSDAFFVHGDSMGALRKPRFRSFRRKTRKWAIPRTAHRRCRNGRERIMLDYEVYLETNGSTVKARKAAVEVCAKWLGRG